MLPKRSVDRSRYSSRRTRVGNALGASGLYSRALTAESLEARTLLVATSLSAGWPVPYNVEPGAPFSVTVYAYYSPGNTDTTFNSTVTLSLLGPGTLGGTVSVQAIAGVATFSNLTLNGANVGPNSLVASSGTLISAPVPAYVAGLQVRPDPQNPSLNNLVWYGLPGNDEVSFQQVAPGSVQVTETRRNGQATNVVQTFHGINGRVIADGMNGDDTLNASGLASISATLDGSNGSNTLYGGHGGDVLIGGANGGEGRHNTIVAGNGNNVIYGDAVQGYDGGEGSNNLIVGGTGNDTIYGNYQYANGGEGGRNLIVGGGGSDTIYGDATDRPQDSYNYVSGSIVIAGTTNLSVSALRSILNEYDRGGNEPTANIEGTGPGGLNGTNYLIPGVTVFDDEIVDTIYGNYEGPSWLFYDFEEDVIGKPGGKSTDL